MKLKKIVGYYDVSHAFIDIMLVFRIGKKADGTGLPVLYSGESRNTRLGITFYRTVENFRYLFGFELHIQINSMTLQVRLFKVHLKNFTK